MIRSEAHAYEKLGKDMKTGRIPGLVLLHGREEYLVHFYANALIKKYVNPACMSLDLVTLDRDHVDSAAVVDNAETICLMSERKVIFLPEFIDTKGKLPKTFESNSRTENFLEYIKSIPDGVLILITMAKQEDDRAEQNLKKTKMYKAIASAGSVYDFEALNPGQLRGFIEKRLRATGKKYKSSLPEFIARESGYGSKTVDYGLYTLENDLKKLAAYCSAADEIRTEDAASVLTHNPENDVFTMLDMIARNRKDEAFRLLHNLLENGENEFQLLAMITKQLELMLMARELKEDGLNLTGIQKELKKTEKVHEYRVKKALDLGNRFPTSDLKRILSSAYEIEVNIKTGLMQGEMALEFFIAGI